MAGTHRLSLPAPSPVVLWRAPAHPTPARLTAPRPASPRPAPRRPASWGKNTQGNLGLGNVHDLGNDEDELGDNLPYTDLGAVGAHRIDGGLDHTCAILADGSVKCWGKNFRGALGLGDFRTRGDFPLEVRY